MENNKKKKTAATVTAAAVAAALLLGGTYAWQSISQEAVNVAAGEVNPGGRLHDDFNGSTKRIYVENFGDQKIYARVKLSEYMEIGTEAGKNFTEDTRNITKITETAEYSDKTTWATHYYEEDQNETNNYWTWTLGGDAVAYLPTFNMNKDSLKADINGTFEGPDGTDGVNENDQNDRYSDYVNYDEVTAPVSGTELRDNDTNTVDEGEDATEENVSETAAEHTVTMTKNSCVISMEEWNGLDEGTKDATECWVYDTDGWAYWSKAINPGEATGPLLRSIENKNLNDSWYYAINATGQFITADDMGQEESTGFYTDGNNTPSTDALALLETIGVDTGVSEDNGGGETPQTILMDTDEFLENGAPTVNKGESYVLEFVDYADVEAAKTNTVKVYGETDYDEIMMGYATRDDITDSYYDADTNTLTIPDGYEQIQIHFTYTDISEEDGLDHGPNAWYHLIVAE